MKPKIECRNISKAFIQKGTQRVHVLQDISLEVRDNEFLVILGPGQSGKSTLLRIIDTRRAYSATNGVDGHGGAIDVGGAMVAGDQLFVSSGYGMFGQMPGNMLLVYGLRR